MRRLSNKEIRFVFHYLKDTLPAKPTAASGLYSLPKALDHAFNGPTQQREAALQRISDHMGHFLGLLDHVRVSFIEKRESGEKIHTVFFADNRGNVGERTTSEFVEEEKYAGLYRVRGYDHGEVIGGGPRILDNLREGISSSPSLPPFVNQRSSLIFPLTTWAT